MSDAPEPPAPEHVLDTSALIDLKNGYPEASFPSLWSKFNALCDTGRIISAREVRREIEAGSDQLPAWAKARPSMFLMPTPEEAALVGSLQAQFPSWVDPTGTKPMADPFVLAMAKARGLPLITHDKKQLLHAARQLKVECIRIPQLIALQGWQF
ncbi:MAG: DUF4411 family protein [Bacteroidetes bacterium]|nr:DUF4411 family protein [Bacteroidota bacterium]